MKSEQLTVNSESLPIASPFILHRSSFTGFCSLFTVHCLLFTGHLTCAAASFGGPAPVVVVAGTSSLGSAGELAYASGMAARASGWTIFWEA